MNQHDADLIYILKQEAKKAQRRADADPGCGELQEIADLQWGYLKRAQERARQ